MNDIKLSKEDKRRMIDKIKEYFLKERDEEIGDLSAEMILDFITVEIAPVFYNMAIYDAYKIMNERIDDLLSLEKRV